MKKTLLIILTIYFYMNAVSQVIEKKKSDKLLKELSEDGCKCIDSINTTNKPKENILNEINACIDKQTEAYQTGIKLKNSGQIESKDKGEIKALELSANTNKNSNEYQDYYSELESYMMITCTTLKNKIAASDIVNKKSYSENPKARKIYSKGVRESEKRNYKKAITYFEKALKVDSLFAFAWDNIGRCNRMLKNYDQAINAYNRSLELDPRGIMPLQNIAVIYKLKKEYEKAISAYYKLDKIDKNNPEVFFGIGEIYSLYLNDYEKGLVNMCKAYNLYEKQKSPYRKDAEEIIGVIHKEMIKLGKEDRFNEILKENTINLDLK